MTLRGSRPTARMLLGGCLVALSFGACHESQPNGSPDPNRARVPSRAVPKVDRGLITSVELVELLRKNVSVLPPSPGGSGRQGLYNPEAVVPPQCYTRHEGKYNPCYVCHQNAIPGRENRANDGGLQRAYSFSETALSNHWKNLFEDRSARIAALSDDEIIEYVNQDNYSELAGRLREAQFRGYVPDLKGLERGAAAFDQQGFANDGSDWVAFSYKPLPSTFWPTNGATDDVMIRLPAKFRQRATGEYSRDVYLANLTLVELTVKDLPELSAPPLNEALIGRDLDGDGRLGRATRVRRQDHYVGGAAADETHSTIYPEGTEFLHTVRYLGVGEDGRVGTATRMKEVRYMVKREFMDAPLLGTFYDEEAMDKTEGNLPRYPSQGQQGITNKMGWLISGFIEDPGGRLRFNTYEETLFCMGCHNTIGTTIDKTFSFPRKVDGAKGWGYLELRGMPDAPNRGETEGEILTYLQRVGGGVEFRNNPEMEQRFYTKSGELKADAVKAAGDVYELITPSAQRALQLNKAYRVIVQDQDYIFGRDPTLVPPHNVYSELSNEDAVTLPRSKQFTWDIRLDWAAASSHPSKPSG